MIKLKICKKIWLKYKIEKLENVLLEEGLRTARSQGLNISFQDTMLKLEGAEEKNNLYLHNDERGRTDISPLLYKGSVRKPEEARKYFIYSEMLDRLNKV